MIQVAAGVIEDEQGRVMLAQRAPHKSYGGLWEFPGGKLEEGESAEQALHRELQEELKLVVRILRHLGDFDHDGIRLCVFVVRPLCAPDLSADVSAIKWLKPNEIQAADLVPADVAVWRAFSGL